MDNKGQTSVEYVLMIAVVVTMLMSVMDIVKTSILGEAKNCAPQSKAIICTFERAFNFEDLRYFTIRR
ncbi:Flp family type IVb pilin [Halobacteriovorax sp. HLS]|uniref:Flp family type IVb pilin n=1 Tax=Halobacteriovorax sp. HLS TaxID=2234000 RepID=UPI000FD95D83|nr:class III signal peptide-containing protein [Halobacteriovorax sp. HLS]